MFRCDRGCDENFKKFGNFVGTKHTPCRRSGTGHEVGRGHSQSPCTPNPRLTTTTEERKLIYTNNKPAVLFSSCKLAPATISVGTDLVQVSVTVLWRVS